MTLLLYSLQSRYVEIVIRCIVVPHVVADLLRNVTWKVYFLVYCLILLHINPFFFYCLSSFGGLCPPYNALIVYPTSKTWISGWPSSSLSCCC